MILNSSTFIFILRSLLAVFLAICLGFQSGATTEVNLQTLKAVQVVFRHGARTLQRTFPSDPYNNQSLWPGGFHQLTCIGEVQCYNLGGFLSSRYNGFLSDNYVPGELYTMSSDIDRTIQSALSVLAGLYPPNPSLGENNTNCNLIDWKDIPVHSTPGRFDPIIRQEAPCARYSYLLDHFYLNSPEMKKLLSDNMDLINYIAGNTGLDISILDGGTIKRLSDYYDALIVERYFNMTLPDWAVPVVGTPQGNYLATYYFRTLTHTPELKQMRTGPLLNQLVENFDYVLGVMNGTVVLTGDDNSGGRNRGRKMVLLSGHDHTLTSLMDTLGVYTNGTRPTFASAVVLELHQNSPQDEPYIQMFFRNDSTVEPYKLEIPGCVEPCHFSQFVEIVTPYRLTYDEWSSLCQQIPGQRSVLLQAVIWAVVAISVIVVIIALVLLCRSIINERRNKRKYDRF